MSSKPVSLAERLKEWCPCILERGRNEPHPCSMACECYRPGGGRPCDDIFHTLEAEVADVEEHAQAATLVVSEQIQRIEALEEVLRSAPEQPGHLNWDTFRYDYKMWKARVKLLQKEMKRAAALADEPRNRGSNAETD